MYKEVAISTIIIILIIILNVITQNYTKESVSFMDEKLNYLKQNILNEENNDLQDSINNLINNWKKRKDKLEYYIEHDELEKVETELMSLKANIEVEEYQEGLPDIEKAIFILNHIKEKYSFKIQNIF